MDWTAVGASRAWTIPDFQGELPLQSPLSQIPKHVLTSNSHITKARNDLTSLFQMETSLIQASCSGLIVPCLQGIILFSYQRRNWKERPRSVNLSSPHINIFIISL